MSRPEPAAQSGALTGCVDVLCDGSGRVGALSYLVPDGMVLRPGDAVQVPFGRRVTYGMVLGPGNPAVATREITEVFGKRAREADIAAARLLAERHFTELASIFPRLAPKSGRGAPAMNAGPVQLREDSSRDRAAELMAKVPGDLVRRLLLRAPLLEPAHLAALEAARLVATMRQDAPDGAAPSAAEGPAEAGAVSPDGTTDGTDPQPNAPAEAGAVDGAAGADAGARAGAPGQVLVLCPTVEVVAAVMAQFDTGAARLDAKAKPGAWKGFVEGTVPIGVGTRSAALYSAKALAGIIVVEEDHPGHLEATQPHCHARDVAVARTAGTDVPLVLISANPTPAAVGAVQRVVQLGTRADWPTVGLVDRSEYPPGQRLLPPPVAGAVTRENKAGRRPLVLAQRQRAVRRCARCGDEWECKSCDSSSCRHPEARPCRRCGVAAGVRIVGWDAERLAELFGERARVVTISELADERDAGLVVLMDIDAATRTPALLPEALAAHLVVTAARAAGREGRVLALTDDPSNQTLVDLLSRRDVPKVAKRTWETAKAAGLPPFGRLVQVRCGQTTKPRVSGWPGTVHGPRRVGDEWEILVRISDQDLPKMGPYLGRLRRGGKTRVTVS